MAIIIIMIVEIQNSKDLIKFIQGRQLTYDETKYINKYLDDCLSTNGYDQVSGIIKAFCTMPNDPNFLDFSSIRKYFEDRHDWQILQIMIESCLTYNFELREKLVEAFIVECKACKQYSKAISMVEAIGQTKFIFSSFSFQELASELVSTNNIEDLKKFLLAFAKNVKC